MTTSFNSDITTAFTAVNTELDETQAVCDLINTQVDSAVVELAESATNVDSAVDTAVAAMATAAGRINTAVALAILEFDKSIISFSAINSWSIFSISIVPPVVLVP